MKRSNFFLPTIKENPVEAKINSHRLMLRSGMIRQSSSGIYSWLPLGLRVLKNIERIIRKGQDLIAQEVLMPTIQDSEIWKKSGRYNDYGKEMLTFTDRHDRELLYGPTNEELITEIFSKNVMSYKSLPLNLYHIQWKFRDEIRPRFGVMRGREFLMKDAYSFDVTPESAIISYNKMFVNYLKIFHELGLKAIPIAADTGPIGGDLSHEFIILADNGESEIYFDNRILELSLPDINYFDEQDINDIVSKWTSFYTAADDKFNNDEFNKSVDKNNRKTNKGIEIGHLFYFGQKYSTPLKANVNDKDGNNIPVYMGSYGIGVSRLAGAIIDAYNDEKGIIWPESVAPFLTSIINVKYNDDKCRSFCEDLYSKLQKLKISVLYDDRNEGPGTKMTEMDLIGIPWQFRVGPRGISNNVIELFNRKTGKSTEISISEVDNYLTKLFLDK
tara:strand:- start:862 stop:2193 length:1332 start_codon:yes stop_codon:yes gene_type:complete